MAKRTLVKIVLHLLFWIGWILFFDKILVLEVIHDIEIYGGPGEQVVDEVSNTSVDPLLLIIVGAIFKAMGSYFILLGIMRRYFQKNKVLSIVLGLTVLGIAFFVESLVAKVIIAHSNVYESIHLEIWNNSNSMQYLILTIILISYLVIQQLILLDRKYLQMEKEKLKSELSFLKYQLNPHLLFNTLNNLFSMSQASGADEVSDGILKLSGIMRYMLYENKESQIPLTKEVDFLKQYADLQLLRVTDENKIKVNFVIEGDTSRAMIPAFVLAPFVENAFKHGVDTTQYSEINVFLKVLDDTIHFEVKNKIFRNQKKLRSNEGGIGILNLKKRLSILFPNAHELNQYELDDHYISKLTLHTKT
ncbi:histidine kinase [Muricauda sp. CAU 1633]|uniref:sensor histidine kinase n=1 Tax=Allomuricauda sp. CAU 1633 TaxID=2816036 RepID=UPI001A8FE286|nr:histidine kinase [Muricauda sp. CAU 1633]MBO0322908.1 histidine kinase [Muricauda sp. CAU 1633]